jgi:hypothetical protein
MICRLLGHKLARGYQGGPQYLRHNGGTFDGMGTEHLYLYGRCARCGNEFHVANLHGPAGAKRTIPPSAERCRSVRHGLMRCVRAAEHAGDCQFHLKEHSNAGPEGDPKAV